MSLLVLVCENDNELREEEDFDIEACSSVVILDISWKVLSISFLRLDDLAALDAVLD